MRMALLANVLMAGLACIVWSVYGKAVTAFFSKKTDGCNNGE